MTFAAWSLGQLLATAPFDSDDGLGSKAPFLTEANIVRSTSKTGSTSSLTDVSIFVNFAAKTGLDFCRKGRIGGVTGAS